MDKDREALTAFYNKALTVNTETTPTEVLSSILAENLVSYGSVDSKGKNELIGLVGFFWNLIPDLKWEIQEILQDNEKYVIRSKAKEHPMAILWDCQLMGQGLFEIMTIDIHRVENGVIQDIYHIEDWATAMKQLKG